MVLVHAIDDMVLAFYLLVTLSISVHRGLRRQKQPQATLMTWGHGLGPSGGHAPAHSSVMSVAVSVVATFMSALFILGVTAEVTQHGATWLLTTLGSLAAVPVIAFVFIPVLNRLQVSSVHEYLCVRYGDGVSPAVGAVGSLLQTVVHVSALLQAAALITAGVTGMRRTQALLVTAVIGITPAALRVPQDRVFSDSVHSFVTFIGLVAIVMQGTGSLGGINNMLEINGRRGRLNVLRFRIDPFERYNFFNVVVGGAQMWTHWFVTSPTMLLHYSSLRTMQRTRTSVLVSVTLLLGVTSLGVLAALSVQASWVGCWPADWPADGLLLHWVGRRLSYLPGLPGLLLAAPLGGALAAGPTQLASQADAVWNQLATERVRHQWRHQAVRIIAAALGLSALCLAAMISGDGGGGLMQTWVAVYGAAAGPLLGLLILGMMVPFSSAQGAAAGYVCGLVLALWTAFGAIFCGTDETDLSTLINATNCYTLLNDTSILGSPDVQGVSVITELLINGTGVDTSGATVDIDDRSPLERWYSLSFLLVSLLATVVTVIVGAIISLLPGCRHLSHLRRDTLSPLVTWLMSENKLAAYTDQGLLNRAEEPEPSTNVEMDNIETTRDQQLYEDHNPPVGHLEMYETEELETSAV